MILRRTLVAGLVWLVAACAQTPTSPDAQAGAGAAVAESSENSGRATVQKAKPGASQAFTFQFVDMNTGPHPNDISGEPVTSEVSGGPVQLTGSVSGSTGSRVFTLSGGPLTLTVQNVRRDHAGSGCGAEVEDLLRTKQLVGAPLNGTSAKLVVSEADDTANLVVDGITGADGQTWRVVLFSTAGSHAQISETGGTLAVIQNYGEVNFRVPSPRGNKNLESYGACKLYFGFTLTPAP